jgi:preprotein translocase subunit SecA
LQNYFRLYDKLSGMTGTAMTEASEFYQIYKLGVIPIPTNKVMQRVDQSDLVYKTEHAKFLAVVDDLVERHRKGQPVLVGTVSVEKSEELSSFLVRKGVAHEVLNAKQHEREAAIVARAGCKGSVTVATNMAGRGTDIMLGGNPEFFADFALQQRGFSPVETPEDYEREWPAELARQRQLVAAEHDEVVALGGLYVLGTERHESRRIDNQLRGRSGRQGDPGESRFYLSLQDELMRRFNSALVERFLGAAGIPEDVPIESKMVSNAIKSAQTQVESQNFEIRKNVLKYDDVLNRQRQVIYVERRSVLEGADLRDQMIGFIDDAVRGQVDFATANTFPEEWNLDVLWQQLRALYPVTLNYEKLIEEAGDISGLSSEYLSELVSNDALSQYELREQTLTPEITRELERRVVLSVLDRRWRDHLYEMDYLQEGIGLRAMAQRDPLVEYQKEGYELFTAMMEGIKEESVGFLFHAEVNVERTSQGELASASLPELGGGEQELHYSAPGESGAPEQQSVRAADETSRNAQCPCGSGKKYKRCHGDPRNR